MSEFLNVLKDIKSGALPANEIPGFLVWKLGNAYWLWLPVILILAARLIRKLIKRLLHHVPGTSIRSNRKVR